MSQANVNAFNALVANAIEAYPVLWYKIGIEQTDNSIWDELSEKTQTHKTYLQTKWLQLRTDYVKHRTSQHNKTTCQQTAVFLSTHPNQLQFLENDPDNWNKLVEHFANSNENSDTNNEYLEFCITEDDLIDDNDGSDDPATIFQELRESDADAAHDECNSGMGTSTLSTEDSAVKLEQNVVHSNRSTLVTEGIILNKASPTMGLHKRRITPQPALTAAATATTTTTTTTNSYTMQNTNAARCEDTIFGELVTAMLLRMEPAEKKRVKKEIMNLLL